MRAKVAWIADPRYFRPTEFEQLLGDPGNSAGAVFT